MKANIEQQLGKIIGMPMFSIGRASNMLWAGFGEPRIIMDRLGNEKKVGDFSIHVQCSWRIASLSTVLVASHDFYVPGASWTGEQDDFDWDVHGNNLFDERIEGLFPPDRLPVVTTVHADDYGGFKIIFTSDLVFEAFPSSSDDTEHWRMFVPGNTDEHFVVLNGGIST